MTRNTLRRVEVAAPIYDPELRSQLNEMFITMLSDNQQARELQNDGNYIRLQAEGAPLNSQEYFFPRHMHRNRGWKRKQVAKRYDRRKS